MLGTQQVSWSVTLLVIRGLVRLGAFGLGPPQITARGLQMLDGWAGLHVSEISNDQIERHTIQLVARRPPGSDVRSRPRRIRAYARSRACNGYRQSVAMTKAAAMPPMPMRMFQLPSVSMSGIWVPAM
jgi:hypothetical protein